jgi:alkyl hydroperoxide reductase subunit AhpC
MNIPIIADLTKDISRNYGVLMEEKGFSARGTFIIDGKGMKGFHVVFLCHSCIMSIFASPPLPGTLRQYSVNDPPVGRNVDEVLRLVSAFQYTDKNGEVCPAKWTYVFQQLELS